MAEEKELVNKENLEQVVSDAHELTCQTQKHDYTEEWSSELEDDLTRAKEIADQISNTITLIIEENTNEEDEDGEE